MVSYVYICGRLQHLYYCHPSTTCRHYYAYPKNTNGEFWIAQIVRERVLNGGRSVEEATRADSLSSRSRDDEKALLKPGRTQGGANGRYWHRDAVIGEVPGGQPVEAFEDQKTDIFSKQYFRIAYS